MVAGRAVLQPGRACANVHGEHRGVVLLAPLAGGEAVGEGLGEGAQQFRLQILAIWLSHLNGGVTSQQWAAQQHAQLGLGDPRAANTHT